MANWPQISPIPSFVLAPRTGSVHEHDPAPGVELETPKPRPDRTERAARPKESAGGELEELQPTNPTGTRHVAHTSRGKGPDREAARLSH